jgi:hypothetical protein
MTDPAGSAQISARRRVEALDALAIAQLFERYLRCPSLTTMVSFAQRTR